DDAAGAMLVLGEPPWAVDGLAGVRDAAVPPATDLVPEDPGAAGSATADRPFRHDAAPRTVRVADRRLLDHEAPLRKPHLERGVVEVARRAPPDPGRQRLEQPAVEPDEVAARAER